MGGANMTEDENSISRRNVLAGLGAIGVGGALAGAGTSAFFSDKETFPNNKLVAGALDLKVDWQEHYSDWSDDEGVNNEPVEGSIYDDDLQFAPPGDEEELETGERFEVLMEEPDNPEGYIGFPSQADEPLIWVHDDYADDFLRSTAIEAYPDFNNDGIQDFPDDWDICEQDADTNKERDGVLSSDLRTNTNDEPWNGSGIGGEPNPQTTMPGDPLINISDVKPGDFGELTLSFHLCDNPGYVWLTGKLRDASENGLTEPERKDPDEEEDVVELLDEIKTQFWIDDGDNVYEPDDGEELLFPAPISLREALKLLETGNGGLGIPINPDGGGDGSVFGPGTCLEEDFDSVQTGEEAFPDGTMRQQMNPFCSDFGLVEALKVEDADLPDSGTQTYTTPYGDVQITTSDRGTITSWDTDATPNGELDDEDGFCVSKVIVKGGREGANIYSYDADSNGSSGDDGTFTPPTDQDISNVSFCVDLKEQPDGDRECFENSTTYYVGFSWWLPVDHANEIQTDSVEFDLGFYTEQCRHNDGSGMRPKDDTEPVGVSHTKKEE